MKHLWWRNVCSREPVVLAELALGVTFDWTSAYLPEPILELLQKKLPGLRTEAPAVGAAQLVADIAQVFQMMLDVTTRNSGVISRDAKSRTAIIFFSYRDPFLAQAMLVTAAKFVGDLCRSVPTAVWLSAQLDRSLADANRHGLDQYTRAMIRSAEKRGTPWLRISHMNRHIQFGQGLKQRRIAGTLADSESKIASSDIAGPNMESIYPKADNGRILTAMITGTAGKTTTSLMLRSILATDGHVVGTATTDGVTVGNKEVLTGDAAGTNGAEAVLRDPTVTAAVLETARGDLLMSGMYLDRCDVAALLNVGREQIGMDGIDTLDQMAEHKRKVINAATIAAVLNADDARCLTIAKEIRSTIRTIMFSANSNSPDIREHIERGGEAIVVRPVGGRSTIVIESKPNTIPLVAVADMPATMGGLIAPNVWNAMAACGLALGLGVVRERIEQGLRQYQISLVSSRGRFNFLDGFPMKILFDRAASPPELAAALSVVSAIESPGRRFCATTVPGNRAAWHVEECARNLAGHFDKYVCYERADWQHRNPKGTKPGELAERMARALIIAGVDGGTVKAVKTSKDCAYAIAREARAGDLVAIFSSDIRISVDEYRTAFTAATAVP